MSLALTSTNRGLYLMAYLCFQAIADTVSDQDLEKGSLYPPLSSIRACSVKIATDIANYAYEKGDLILLKSLV